VTTRSNGLARITILVAALSVAACGSDRAGVTTAPSSAAAANGAPPAATPNTIFAPRDHDGSEREHVEGEGIITAVDAATSCPTLRFSIGSKSIGVTADTIFERGACSDLTIGRRVHVTGDMLGDDVIATRVEIQNESPGHPEVEGESRVTSLVSGTSCPALKFKVDEWTVTLSASTTFVNGACADVAVGRKVGVKGTVTGEHQVLATRVIFKGDRDDD